MIKMSGPASSGVFRNTTISGGTIPTTTRISEEKWKKYKPIILEKYEKGTLQSVKEEMMKEHGFSATTRQFVHHIGTVWKVKKYKQGQGGPGKKKKKKRSRNASSQPDATEDGTPSENPSQAMTNRRPDSPPRNQKPDDDFLITQFGSVRILRTVGSTSLSHHVPEPNTTVTERTITMSEQSRWHLPQSRLQANILFACGYSVAFSLYRELCRSSFWPRELLADLICCTRAALTADLDESRDILQEYINDILEEYDEGSPLATLVDLQAARTYDCGYDEVNALGQIDARILTIMEDCNGHAKLKYMPSERHCLDIPLYIYLYYALKRWNDVAESSDEIMNIDDILKQFVVQQLAQTADLICLISCLEWVLHALEKHAPIPEALSNTSGNISSTEATYQVIAALWTDFRRDALRDDSDSWIQHSQSELGISSAELLTATICMIMTEVGADSFETDADVIQGALRGSQNLAILKTELLDRFLQQIRWTNHRRFFCKPTPIGDTYLRRFRDFVSESLGVDQLPAEFDPQVHILELGPVDKNFEPVEQMYLDDANSYLLLPDWGC